MERMRATVEAVKRSSGVSSIALCRATQPCDWLNLLFACSGFEGTAERISGDLDDAARAEEGTRCKLPGTPVVWQTVSDAENLTISPTGQAIGAYGDRFAGMRPMFHSTDPAVLHFTAELLAYQHLIPRPDDAIVAKAKILGFVEKEGNIIAIDGVPFPASRAQVSAFLAIRFRWLLAHPMDHCGDNDDAKDSEGPKQGDHIETALKHLNRLDLSDHSLMQLLGYNAKDHRANLIKLQHCHFPLFWAVWRNDFCQVDQITTEIGSKTLSEWLVDPDHRFSGKMRDPAFRLLCGTAIFGELTRLFEILVYLHSLRSITRESIQALLHGSSSLKGLAESGSPTSKYLLGSFAQNRGAHPSMNRHIRGVPKDRGLRAIGLAVKNTRSYQDTSTRLARPFGEVPAVYFIGIEQQFIPLAAIIMMIGNMKKLEGEYFRRRRRGPNGWRRNEDEAVRLAAVIAANVHPRWARALLNAVDNVVSDQDWLQTGMTGTAKRERINGNLTESSRAPQSDEIAGDRNHYRLYGKVSERVAKLSKVREPGWTRCFYFEAWLPTSAETTFLEKCATFQSFSQDAAIAHQARMIEVRKTCRRDAKWSNSTPNTGLPRQNPVEIQHDRMRPFMAQLQFPDLLQPRFQPSVKTRDVFVSEVAKLLPAVTPFTLDPHLNEQIRFAVDARSVAIAIEGAWRTTRQCQ